MPIDMVDGGECKKLQMQNETNKYLIDISK